MIIVVPGILDTLHCLRLQITHHVFDGSSSSIFWLNGENGECTVVGLTESAAVNT
jgi:hypothetical protein